MFYGLGVNYNKSPLTYSENGVDYTTVYFYKNGVKLDLSDAFAFERYTPTSTVNVSDAIYKDGKYTYCVMKKLL